MVRPGAGVSSCAPAPRPTEEQARRGGRHRNAPNAKARGVGDICWLRVLGRVRSGVLRPRSRLDGVHPYHVLRFATGRNPWQRFPPPWTVSRPSRDSASVRLTRIEHLGGSSHDGPRSPASAAVGRGGERPLRARYRAVLTRHVLTRRRSASGWNHSALELRLPLDPGRSMSCWGCSVRSCPVAGRVARALS